MSKPSYTLPVNTSHLDWTWSRWWRSDGYIERCGGGAAYHQTGYHLTLNLNGAQWGLGMVFYLGFAYKRITLQLACLLVELSFTVFPKEAT
jgi:hypothetical protein